MVIGVDLTKTCPDHNIFTVIFTPKSKWKNFIMSSIKLSGQLNTFPPKLITLQGNKILVKL